MRNKFLKIAGVAVLGAILLCVLFGVFQRPVNRGIWLMENVEALTLNEGTPSHSCARRSGPNGKLEQRMFCDSRTSATMIYPCPMASSVDFYVDGNMDRCTD